MLNQILNKTVSSHSDATAIVYEDRRISYFELFVYVEWMARYFQSIAVQPGQRVAILIPSSPELVISLLGLVRIGGVALPLEVTGKEHELEAALELSRVNAIITTPPYKALLDNVVSGSGYNGAPLPDLTVAVFEEDNIVTLGGRHLERQILIPNSRRNGRGSSLKRNHDESVQQMGDPNGRDRASEEEQIFTDHPALIQVLSDKARAGRLNVRSHRDLAQEAEWAISHLQLTATDRVLCAASLCQAKSLSSCLIASIAAGATLVLLETYNWNNILQVLAEERVTILASPAAFFVRLMESFPAELPDLSSLRWCFCTDAPLSPEVSERLHHRIGINIRQLTGHLDARTPQRPELCGG